MRILNESLFDVLLMVNKFGHSNVKFQKGTSFEKVDEFYTICRVRGVLGSTKILTFNFGVLLALVLGWVSHYNTIPIFLIVSVTLFTILFAFFPESPTILVKQNQIMVRN